MSSEIALTRKLLKQRLLCDYGTFRQFDKERAHVKDLLERIVNTGESNSALICGSKGSGKSTLVSSVVLELMENTSFVKNSILIYLNGLIHVDDKVALKSIASQMRLDNAVDGKVFGSFSENLAFLLACLKSGDKKVSKSCIFILEEFDLFCSHHNQTLLYNLFDVAQSAQAPICVFGLTSRLDVVELLEKRVKSRFSHRQIFLFPSGQEWREKLELFRNYLLLPTKPEAEKKIYWEYLDNCEMHNLKRMKNTAQSTDLSKKWISDWNKNIKSICDNEKVQSAIKEFCNFDNLESTWKLIMLEVVIKLNDTNSSINVQDVLNVFHKYQYDDRISLLCDLSVMEFCLVIAMKHHCEIYDRDPFNFEMIYKRLLKFTNSSASMQQLCGRNAMLKAFECLKDIELISSVNSRTQKEFQMYRLLLTFDQIKDALNKYQGMPTEIIQWAQSSLV